MKYNYKKSINILSVLFLILVLSSCFGGTNEDDVEKAKQDLGIIEQSTSNDEDTGGSIDIEADSLEGEELKEFKQVEITSITDEQFIELDDLSGEDFSDGEVEIKGITLQNVDKIIITFENKDSQFPIDKYDLKQFKKGDKTFLYRAFSRYETLDYGKNIYIIEAFSGDKVSKTQLVINLEQDLLKKEKVKDLVSSENIEELSTNSLPTGVKFGTPTKLGNGKIGYTDLKGLEIKTKIFPDLSCENLTEVYSDVIGGYFYWNTCRPLGNNEGFSFFVVRLDGDKYFYEKHYYLSNNSIYGVQELESGEGVARETLGDKNTELKAKNSEYPILKISDSLFNEIMK
ncbi:MAG: hypothetical protein Q8K30_00310 [Candidatus Gracilibacteria bacterium]|nr:hypothetical protein [Candidatus Gracilibacteria bacterium]